MKKLLFGISVVALMLTTSCGNKVDQDRIAQLEKELAQLKSGDYNESSSSTSSYSAVESDYSSSTDNTPSESKTLSSYKGTYKFTDNAGNTWVLTLNDDETAQIKRGNELHYGSWYDYENINRMYIDFAYDDAPVISFPFGQQRGILMAISKDGYIYADMDARNAKNPRKRLPIKKIK